VRNILDAPAHEVVGWPAHDLAEALVDAEKAAVKLDVGDADSGLLKCVAIDIL
jgi:hypothetical protein